MKRSGFPRFILFPIFVFALLVPLGLIIMALWNNILVAVLHVSVINFWQALGLFALSRILFGGFPGKPGWGRNRFRRREMEEMRNKWFNMSPEEKQNFKQNWRNRCGGQMPATADAKAGTPE
jgi:hypothetical protein